MVARGTYHRTLALLRKGPLVRFGGGWRFGTRKVSERALAPFLAAGRAFLDEAGAVRLTPTPEPVQLEPVLSDKARQQIALRRQTALKGWATRRALSQSL